MHHTEDTYDTCSARNILTPSLGCGLLWFLIISYVSSAMINYTNSS